MIRTPERKMKRSWRQPKTARWCALVAAWLATAVIPAFGQLAARPSIATFQPALGAPGTTVVIHGANFTGLREVRFSQAPAVFTLVSSTQINAIVPLDATTGPISVITTASIAMSSVSFQVAPRIIEFAPTNGPPGAVVTILGANFSGAASVQFNNQTATNFSIVADTQIHAVIPNAARSGPIRVTTPAGTASSTNVFIVTGTEPILTEFFPTNGVPGTVVTLEGRNFSGATAVKFNGRNAATFSVTADTQILATVPAHATTGPISVTSLSGTGTNATPFLVTLSPVLSRFAPTNGPPGTKVVIDGFNFTGATAVRFNESTAAVFSVTSPTQLETIVPANGTTGPIRITTPLGTGQSELPFVVALQPIISFFTPTNGPPGTQVTIEGVNFLGATRVTFGTNSAAFSIVGPTQISAIVPTNAVTGVITVSNPNGSGSGKAPFIVVGNVPVVADFHPRTGVPGVTVTLEGLNFTGATAVRFNGAAAAFSVTAPTQILAVVPAEATSGPVSVTTTSGTGQSTKLFLAPPRLSEFSPTNGLAGARVLIQGTNFIELTSVEFNGVPSSFTNLSPHQISAAVPANATTGPIRVATPAGAAISTNVFAVLPQIDRFTPLAGPAGTTVCLLGSGLAGASSVLFAGVPASFQVVSPNEIQATVPVRAGTGPITVSTPWGTSMTAGVFTAVRSADLQLTMTGPASPLPLGGNLTYLTTITNLGPSEATGIVLTNLLPAPAHFVSATVTQGAFTRQGSTLIYNTGNLRLGAAAALTVVVTPTRTGTFTNQIAAAGAEFDPDLANNVRLAATAVIPGPTTLAIERLSDGRLSVSWPAAATNYFLQAREQFAPASSWQRLTNSPAIVGDRKILFLPRASESRFFRLGNP